MRPETFLTSHSLFTRAELASVLCVHGRVEATVDSHLARWVRQGRIAPVKKGVFIRLDTPQGPHERSPDFVVLASRMAPDAAIAYHTALEAHGFAQTILERMTFVTWTKTKPTTFQGRRLVPVRPGTRGWAPDDDELEDGGLVGPLCEARGSRSTGPRVTRRERAG